MTKKELALLKQPIKKWDIEEELSKLEKQYVKTNQPKGLQTLLKSSKEGKVNLKQFITLLQEIEKNKGIVYLSYNTLYIYETRLETEREFQKRKNEVRACLVRENAEFDKLTEQKKELYAILKREFSDF